MQVAVSIQLDDKAVVYESPVKTDITDSTMRFVIFTKRGEPFRQRTFDLGFRPEVPYDKALQLASAVEDQELVRKLSLGK